MQGQTEGRIVHYVVKGDEYPGAEKARGNHRPAMIVWSIRPGYANLLLFLDGLNDGAPSSNPVWVTSREEGEGEGKWHGVERT